MKLIDLKDDNLYYIGGVVRDEILKKKSRDIDFCYEGNAIEFAKEKGLNIIKENPKFGTVRVLIEDKEVDIASTRTETYPKKGHLPVVENIGCSIEEDTFRRDFTINSLAKRTTNGELIDYWGGMVDMENKLLRVHHENSFIDDPTRIIRALKFSVRFGFKLAEMTEIYQKAYLDNINYDISYHRLKKELIETFSLNRQVVLEKFIRQGLYKLLGPNVQAPNIEINISKILQQYPTQNTWLVYLSFFDLSNLELTRSEKKILDWANRLKKEKPNNNTPIESILINKIKAECGF